MSPEYGVRQLNPFELQLAQANPTGTPKRDVRARRMGVLLAGRSIFPSGVRFADGGSSDGGEIKEDPPKAFQLYGEGAGAAAELIRIAGGTVNGDHQTVMQADIDGGRNVYDRTFRPVEQVDGLGGDGEGGDREAPGGGEGGAGGDGGESAGEGGDGEAPPAGGAGAAPEGAPGATPDGEGVPGATPDGGKPDGKPGDEEPEEKEVPDVWGNIKKLGGAIVKGGKVTAEAGWFVGKWGGIIAIVAGVVAGKGLAEGYRLIRYSSEDFISAILQSFNNHRVVRGFTSPFVIGPIAINIDFHGKITSRKHAATPWPDRGFWREEVERIIDFQVSRSVLRKVLGRLTDLVFPMKCIERKNHVTNDSLTVDMSLGKVGLLKTDLDNYLKNNPKNQAALIEALSLRNLEAVKKLQELDVLNDLLRDTLLLPAHNIIQPIIQPILGVTPGSRPDLDIVPIGVYIKQALDGQIPIQANQINPKRKGYNKPEDVLGVLFHVRDGLIKLATEEPFASKAGIFDETCVLLDDLIGIANANEVLPTNRARQTVERNILVIQTEVDLRIQDINTNNLALNALDTERQGLVTQLATSATPQDIQARLAIIDQEVRDLESDNKAINNGIDRLRKQIGTLDTKGRRDEALSQFIPNFSTQTTAGELASAAALKIIDYSNRAYKDMEGKVDVIYKASKTEGVVIFNCLVNDLGKIADAVNNGNATLLDLMYFSELLEREYGIRFNLLPFADSCRDCPFGDIKSFKSRMNATICPAYGGVLRFPIPANWWGNNKVHGLRNIGGVVALTNQPSTPSPAQAVAGAAQSAGAINAFQNPGGTAVNP